MGDPKKIKKKYIRPRKPWDKKRLDEERNLKETYGLKNKKELWITEKILKNKRQNARKLLALELDKRLKREKELLDSLRKTGLIKGNATLDDVLGLRIEEFLERRLETIVWRKGLANTPKQARQFIVHGHIAVNGKKVSTPSYMIKADEENKIAYYKKELKLKQEKKQKKDLKKESEKAKEGTEETETKEPQKEEHKEKTDERKETGKEEKKETKEKNSSKKEKITEKKTEKEENAEEIKTEKGKGAGNE